MAIDIAAWYKKYGSMVIRRCRVLLRDEDEAMDAVQDVFVNLLRAEGRLNGSYPSSFLYTVATNVCLNRLRDKKREAPGNLTDGTEALLVVDENFEQVNAELLVGFILEDESEETRTILFMYYADGMILKEIADVLDLSISGVKKKIDSFKRRARLKLGEE